MHTILLSLVMQLGNAVHSYTLGFFLNLVLQLGMLLSAFAYGFTLMRRWQIPYKLRWAALAIICIVEFFPMESTVVEKDIPYAACVIFLVLLLYELVRQMHKGNGMNRVQMVGYVLACIGTAGFRNEGIYLVLIHLVSIKFYLYMLFLTSRYGYLSHRTQCFQFRNHILLYKCKCICSVRRADSLSPGTLENSRCSISANAYIYSGTGTSG